MLVPASHRLACSSLGGMKQSASNAPRAIASGKTAAESGARTSARPVARPGGDAQATTAPRVRLRLRVTCGEEVAIGPGKIDLLEAIRVQGSITMAAKSLGMSYRRAWLLVDEMNRLLRKPVTTSSTGGAHGGGCTLTPDGEELVRLYRGIERRAAESCADEIRRLMRMVAKG